MTSNAQAFWLQNLEHAGEYNQWAFSQIKPHLGEEVLEVGCGTGNFTVLLARHCTRVVALDLDEAFVSAARSRLADSPCVEVCQGDIMKKRWPYSFDSVVMLDVLEHIEDDLEVLRLSASCMKPGGRIIVKVPALSRLYGPMDEAIGHYRRYDKENLEDKMRKAGFSQCNTWFFNLLGITGWWFNSRILRRTTASSEQVGLFNKAVHLLRPIEAIVKPPIGLSLFAVAVKE